MKSVPAYFKVTVLAVFGFVPCLHGQLSDCKTKFTDGRYIYEDKKIGGTIVVEGEMHYEHFDGGVIESKMTWLSDCEVQYTIVKCTVKGVPAKPGDIMVVTFLEIEDNSFTYDCIFRREESTETIVKVK